MPSALASPRFPAAVRRARSSLLILAAVLLVGCAAPELPPPAASDPRPPSRIRIRLEADPVGQVIGLGVAADIHDVYVDGRKVGTLRLGDFDKTYDVSPGSHTVAVVKQGALFYTLPFMKIKEDSVRVETKPGETVTLTWRWREGWVGGEAARPTTEGDARIRAAGHAREARTRIEARRYDDAISEAEAATRLDPQYAPGWYWLGIAHARKNQNEQAADAFRKVIEVRPSGAQLADSYARLGTIYNQQGRPQEAVPALQAAVEANPNDAGALNELGYAYNALRRYEEAVAVLRRAAELDPRFGHNLGFAYAELKQYEEAIRALERAVAAREGAARERTERLLARIEETRTRADQEGRARVKAERESKEQAERESKEQAEREAQAKAEREARDRAQREAPARTAQEARVRDEARARLGWAAAMQVEARRLWRDGRYTEGLPKVREALAIREQAFGPEHRDVADSLSTLGEFLRAMGQYAEAEELHRRALRIRETLGGADHPDVAESLNNLALVHVAQSRYDEAEGLLIRATKILDTPGRPSVLLPESLENLAKVYRARGKIREAQDAEARAALLWTLR
jgi:tetratricopeptide (TPR) repeat protein